MVEQEKKKTFVSGIMYVAFISTLFNVKSSFRAFIKH